MMEKVLVGKVQHYFPKVLAAVVVLEGNLKIGDKISVEGKHTNFEQIVKTMQKDKRAIQQAAKGEDVGLGLDYKVHEGDLVYKVEA